MHRRELLRNHRYLQASNPLLSVKQQAICHHQVLGILLQTMKEMVVATSPMTKRFKHDLTHYEEVEQFSFSSRSVRFSIRVHAM